jgi:hypothetical protein
MKEVAVLLLVTFLLNGCGSSSNTTTPSTTPGVTWQAQVLGGSGPDSGYSFITQFTLNSGGTLNITYFQFLNTSSAQCFPVSGGTQTGQMTLTQNTTTLAVTGTMVYTVQSGGNTLTLNGSSVTGTEPLNGTALTGGLVTGTWSLTGGTGCNDTTGGSFTMTQSAT